MVVTRGCVLAVIALVALCSSPAFAADAKVDSDASVDFGPAGGLNPPHGGVLIDLMASPERHDELLNEVSTQLPSLTLTQRQLCDIEMLMTGGFSPLTGFMDRAQYNGVVENLRLPTGEVWPMPITLDVFSNTAAARAVPGDRIALRDQFFNLVAVLTVTDVYTPDKTREASHVLGTTDVSHPAVNYLFNKAGDVYIGGSLEGVRLPQHFDFKTLRFTPKQLRAQLTEMGWGRFVAFQTRNPMHRAHIELTRLAARNIQGRVLIHPVVGMTKPGDVDYATRVRCYQAVLANAERYYGKGGVYLSLLPLAMRMAGPREALWHSIIRKNHGASHFVVGRDHAGCKSDKGEDFYGPYEAQDLVNKYKDEVGIEIVPFKKLVYLPDTDTYVPFNEAPEGATTMAISGTKFRAMMAAGDPIPDWFSDPDVIGILRKVSPPKEQRGFTVFFTGLSGSGKTTISAALIERLTAANPARRLSVLDGDVVRTHLSKGLGFSIRDRDTNVARIGWVASEVTSHRGICIAAPIAPFEASRAVARELVTSAQGAFVLVHVATSLDVCMKRDVKGLYRKALDGTISEFTGYSHPYEIPEHAELTIDTSKYEVEESVDFILGYLTREGYLNETESLERLQASPEVVTAGIVDSAALLCKTPSKPSVTLGVGAYARSLAALRTQVEALGLTTYAFTDKAFTHHGSRVPGSPPADTVKAVSHGEELDVDTPRAQAEPTNAEEALEMAWGVYVRATGAAALHPEGTVMVTSPRLMSYLPYILRFDPCVKIVAVDEDAELDVLHGMTGKGVPEAAAQSFLADYRSGVAELAAAHPSRVMRVSGAELLAETASLTEL